MGRGRRKEWQSHNTYSGNVLSGSGRQGTQNVWLSLVHKVIIMHIHCVLHFIHPQHGLVYPTTQGSLLQKYLETLVSRLSPGEESFSKSHSLSSMKDFATGLPGTSALRRSSQAIPPSHQYTDAVPSSESYILDDEIMDPEETEY